MCLLLIKPSGGEIVFNCTCEHRWGCLFPCEASKISFCRACCLKSNTWQSVGLHAVRRLLCSNKAHVHYIRNCQEGSYLSGRLIFIEFFHSQTEYCISLSAAVATAGYIMICGEPSVCSSCCYVELQRYFRAHPNAFMWKHGRTSNRLFVLVITLWFSNRSK